MSRADVRYDPIVNPPDPNGQDFEHVVAWLHANGLPTTVVPFFENTTVASANASYTDHELTFLNPPLPPLSLQFYLLMNSPKCGLVTLMQYYGFGDLSHAYGIPEYTPPVPPPPAPEDPPANPRIVGIECFGIPGRFGFVSPYIPTDGQTTAQDGKKYVAIATKTPFGVSGWWQIVG